MAKPESPEVYQRHEMIGTPEVSPSRQPPHSDTPQGFDKFHGVGFRLPLPLIPPSRHQSFQHSNHVHITRRERHPRPSRTSRLTRSSDGFLEDRKLTIWAGHHPLALGAQRIEPQSRWGPRAANGGNSFAAICRPCTSVIAAFDRPWPRRVAAGGCIWPVT